MYQTGAIRKLGRVDKGSAFLDPDILEKQRGITIFTHQAKLQYEDLKLTLLDTPATSISRAKPSRSFLSLITQS